ncbi:hypothetical protein AB0478_45765 [Streptomyces sp. NPDC051917]|uniref:hypothetical protein n=1 Tax=Streptomyces sp. NPDC051917 TaxID=3154754 RepID=UPI0034561D60
MKDNLLSRNKPLAIWVNCSAAITPRRIPAPKPLIALPRAQAARDGHSSAPG